MKKTRIKKRTRKTHRYRLWTDVVIDPNDVKQNRAHNTKKLKTRVHVRVWQAPQRSC